MPITRRHAAVAVLAAVAAWAGVPASAQQSRAPKPHTMTPIEAHKRALAGEIVLLDIRTPDEWRETGVPVSAQPITMHQDAAKFFSALEAATKGDRSKAVALICRTGSRSAALQTELAKAGYTNVIDVAEGVVGGRNGAGWLKAGLPVK
jgi:rhodanese-related sulfurtransferase